MNLEWIEVPGGACRFGDEGRPVVVRTLLWTRTPIANGHLPDSPDGLGPRFPVTEVSHVEATEIAARLGGRLPLSVEWEWMAAGPQQRRWPWGDLDNRRTRTSATPGAGRSLRSTPTRTELPRTACSTWLETSGNGPAARLWAREPSCAGVLRRPAAVREVHLPQRRCVQVAPSPPGPHWPSR